MTRSSTDALGLLVSGEFPVRLLPPPVRLAGLRVALRGIVQVAVAT